MRKKSEELRAEALSRAEHGQSFANYPAIFHGFMAKGITEDIIRPRENVLTYQAWKAKGRYVRKGEHGVKVTTWIDTEPKVNTETGEMLEPGGRRPWTATVFHVSQTEAMEGNGNGR